MVVASFPKKDEKAATKGSNEPGDKPKTEVRWGIRIRPKGRIIRPPNSSGC